MTEPTPAQKLMIEDGLPVTAIIPPEQRREAWIGRKLTKPKPLSNERPKTEDPGTLKLLAERDAKARADAKAKRAADNEARIIKARQKAAKQQQETTMNTATANHGKADQVKALREKRAAAKGPKAAKKAKTPKKANGAKKKAAPKPARAARAKKDGVGAIRPGSKLEAIVGLLTRKEGCTTADVLKATDWPAVSMPQQALAAGLKLRKEKVKGEPTRYYGEAA